MSTEIDLSQSPAAPNGSTPATSLPEVQIRVVAEKAQSRIWNRRWFKVVVGAVLVAVVVGVVGDNVIARQYTPDAAVRGYLAALESRDANAAWTQIEVSAPNQPVAANLTDRTALVAALETARPDISSFEIARTTTSDSTHAVVTVALATSKGSAEVAFPVDRSGGAAFGLFPTWRVVIAPAVIAITVAKGGGAVSIDGRAVSLSPGKAAVAVLPLAHRVNFAETALLASQTVNADATAGAAAAIVYKPQLTPAGSQQASLAVTAYFNQICTKITSASPQSSTCPQSIGSYLTYPGTWQVVGDPGKALSIAIDDAGTVSLGGFYQMVFAYTENGVTGTAHVPAGGAFTAPISLTGSGITIASIAKASTGAGISRPSGATDQDAIALVGKAMAACAGVLAETVADCPQAAPDVIIQNVHWKLNGDPTSGATVRFDGSTGTFVVHGNFSMSVAYTCFGNARNRTSSTSAYDAYLFWNGQAFQLVTIQGAGS